MKKFLSVANYIPRPVDRDFGISMTKPDMSMTPKEIKRRFAAGGLSLPDSLEGSYSDVDWSDLERMNRFERLDYAEHLRKQSIVRQVELNAHYEAERKRKSDDFFERRLQDELQKRNIAVPQPETK